MPPTERSRLWMNARQLIEALGLHPHPEEGGYFRETWRSSEAIPAEALPVRYTGSHVFGTSIYYLLTPETCSAMHRLASDEVFHFYLGDPVEMLNLPPEAPGRRILLGSDILAGQSVQVVVQQGVWQGCRLVDGGSFALMGTTVAPGFEYSDYEHGERDILLAGWPNFAELIEKLTP